MCGYSPSQHHFLIVSHKPNNKGIVRVCPLPNTTICLHIQINPNLSSKRFNDFVIVYIPFPENQMVSCFQILLFNCLKWYCDEIYELRKRIRSIHEKIKSQSYDFFVQMKTFRHSISPNIWPPFFQSDVFCTLCTCSGITKGYRGEAKAF